MLDYGKRILIVLIIAVCIGIMFFGGTHSNAAQVETRNFPQSWIWPTEGNISDHFGARNGEHKGMDIAGPLHRNIKAVSDGVVSKSYYSNSYGHVIFIQHEKEGYETVYAHLNERLVGEGELIKQGQVIGMMGNTGNSRGVHLHFEVHRNHWTVEKENAINPLVVLGNTQIVDSSEQNIKATSENIAEAVSRSNKDDNAIKEDFYIVQKGDTLWGLSKKYGISTEVLKENNNLVSDTIYVDQQLIIKKNVIVSMVDMHSMSNSKILEEYLG